MEEEEEEAAAAAASSWVVVEGELSDQVEGIVLSFLRGSHCSLAALLVWQLATVRSWCHRQSAHGTLVYAPSRSLVGWHEQSPPALPLPLTRCCRSSLGSVWARRNHV